MDVGQTSNLPPLARNVIDLKIHHTLLRHCEIHNALCLLRDSPPQFGQWHLIIDDKFGKQLICVVPEKLTE